MKRSLASIVCCFSLTVLDRLAPPRPLASTFNLPAIPLTANSGWNHFVRLQRPFAAGLRRLDQLTVYTSRGTGYWGPPKRSVRRRKLPCCA